MELESGNPDDIENLVSTQKMINHYKRGLSIELFRIWYLVNLHKTLLKLPKNPRIEKSKKRIEYIRNITNYFGITETKPFSGVFYFENFLDNDDK